MTHVCAWVANIEFNSTVSTIEWYFREDEAPNCAVLTKTPTEPNVRIEIFENPAADPDHRFVYFRTSVRMFVNRIEASLQWQKPIQGSEFIDILKPFSQKERSIWESAGTVENEVSVKEYVLPPEAQVGPREAILSKFVPKDMLPDWDKFKAIHPTPTPTPSLEDRLKSLGYELRSSRRPGLITTINSCFVMVGFYLMTSIEFQVFMIFRRKLIQ